MIGRPAPEQRVFFVVGRGRSGTTLLSRMLGQHPALSVAPEGFFVLNLRRRYGRGPWSEARVTAFCHDLVLENRMAAWELDLQDVAARLCGHLPSLTFARACAEVYLSFAEVTEGRAGVRFVGDKNPHYGLFADRLAAVFPEARFIHIVRDPRDNVLSYQTVPFDLGSTAALAARWKRYNRALMRAAQRIPERFLRLRYEDLVREPGPMLSRVCGFLGVPYAAEMERFFEHRPESFYGADSAWFEKLGRPLDAGQAEKWRSAMTPETQAVVQHICEAEMRQLGYPLTSQADGASGARLALRQRADAALGHGSVAAERLIFGALPPELRIWGINTYRARTGRV